MVLAVPSISPRVADLCAEHGWSWIDLAGNCLIDIPGLLHIQCSGRPPVHSRPRPVANLSTREAGRVIRALLRPENAGLRWTQRRMVEHFKALDRPIPSPSLGLVNKVVRLLRDEAYKQIQLVVDVDLKDGDKPVQVGLEFLAPKEVKLKKNRPRLVKDFRVLQADGGAAAFRDPIQTSLSGRNVQGATNTVHLRIASLPDFLVMKAYAIGGREKPKDSYDFCYCMEHVEGGMDTLASSGRSERERRTSLSRSASSGRSSLQLELSGRNRSLNSATRQMTTSGPCTLGEPTRLFRSF